MDARRVEPRVCGSDSAAEEEVGVRGGNGSAEAGGREETRGEDSVLEDERGPLVAAVLAAGAREGRTLETGSFWAHGEGCSAPLGSFSCGSSPLFQECIKIVISVQRSSPV